MTSTATAATPSTTGKLLAVSGDCVELGIPDTDYRLHLRTSSPLDAHVGQRITGLIHARAKRVDVVGAGGRFVEPVFGRPRRIQGRIIGGDPATNRIFVSCGPTFICELTDARQSASDFSVGQLVAFDVEAGASFEPT